MDGIKVDLSVRFMKAGGVWPTDVGVIVLECPAGPDALRQGIESMTLLKNALRDKNYTCIVPPAPDGCVLDADGEESIGHLYNDPRRPGVFFSSDASAMSLDTFSHDVTNVVRETPGLEMIYIQ